MAGLGSSAKGDGRSQAEGGERPEVGTRRSRAGKAMRSWPELVAPVRQLRRRRPKGGQRSLRDISAELTLRGYVNERGRPFSGASIAAMLPPGLLKPTHTPS
jgi:hypothetical protein